MRRINRRPSGMLLKKRFMPRFENGGEVESDKTVSDLLKYLSEYGRSSIGTGLGIDRTPLDVELQGIGRRLSPEESDRLDAEESEKHRKVSVQGLEEYKSQKAHDEKVKAMGRQPIPLIDSGKLDAYGFPFETPIDLDQRYRESGYIRESPKPLRGLRTQGLTEAQRKDAEAKAGVPDAAFESARWGPGTGEVIDTAELIKVAITGEDFYGEERDPLTFGAMTAAGYVIPNVLEKPLKSAWRAIKKFPSKMSTKAFREVPKERQEAILGNLITAHEEVYKQSGVTNGILLPEDLQWMRNVRQLPSLMSGSKLENSVGKDGMIKISEIENLINNKNTSAAERDALQAALKEAKKQEGLTPRGTARLEGGNLDYNDFRRMASFQSSHQFGIKETDQYATYGLNNLDINTHGDNTVGYDWSGWNPRTKLIRTADPELRSTDFHHFGEDAIGHYRTFERPDEDGVRYISEMQSDPMQARGPEGGPKEVTLPGANRLSDDVVKKEMDRASTTITSDKNELDALDNVKTRQDMQDWVTGALGFRRNAPSSSLFRKHYGIAKDHVDEHQFARAISFNRTLDAAPSSRTLTEWRIQGRGNELIEPEVISRVREPLEEKIALTQAYHDGLAGGWRGGPTPKQRSLIKNQDQFLISHILQNEAHTAERLRFPTGDTTGKVQGYGDLKGRISKARGDVAAAEATRSWLRDNPLVDRAFKDHPILKEETVDQIVADWAPIRMDYIHKRWGEGFEAIGDTNSKMRRAVFDWFHAERKLLRRQNHLKGLTGATEQAQLGIMKGYDDLPKALKKHGLEAKKVLDDAGNTWWEVETPAKLGARVGEIRAFKDGGKFRILKKQL